MSATRDVIVIGAGMAGLTLGWRLQQRRPDLDVVVLEASDRAGGRIRSDLLEHASGRFLIELGPDSMLNASKPWARQLCTELGLDDDVLPVNAAEHPTALWHDGRPVNLPTGLSLLAPLVPEAFLGSGLLSPEGACRALQEPEIPVRDGNDDESLGSFVTRRFGREHLDAIAEPLLAGIYNADPDELGLLASFPNVRKLELEYGSVTRGARELAGIGSDEPAFFALREGIETLPATLARALGERLHTGCRVVRLERCDPTGYRVVLETGEHLSASSIVVATPVSSARELLHPIAPCAIPLLDTLKHSTSGAIVAAWPDGAIERPLPGLGLVIPKREHRPLNAITVKSRKYPGRAPEGWSLFRFFFGGYRSPQTVAMDDETLLRTTCAFAAEAMGARGAPAFFRIARWMESSPIYQVGHLDTIAALDAALPPGLHLIGAPYRGPGIPDVVRTSTELAARMADSFVPPTV